MSKSHVMDDLFWKRLQTIRKTEQNYVVMPYIRINWHLRRPNSSTNFRWNSSCLFGTRNGERFLGYTNKSFQVRHPVVLYRLIIWVEYSQTQLVILFKFSYLWMEPRLAFITFRWDIPVELRRIIIRVKYSQTQLAITSCVWLYFTHIMNEQVRI